MNGYHLFTGTEPGLQTILSIPQERIMNISEFLKSLKIEIISWVIFLVTKFCYFTSKKEFINRELFDSVSDNENPVIYACWHGRLYIVPQIRPKGKKVKCIISNNFDGEIIARVVRKSGFFTIRGSSNKMPDGRVDFKDKKGMQVLRSGVKALKQGYSLGITPDGPKGPAHKFKSNSLYIASLSGARILTFTFSATNPIIFKSWDNFMLPRPFSKITVIFGEFFEIEKNITKEGLEKHGKAIENNLNKITDEADKLCGVELEK